MCLHHRREQGKKKKKWNFKRWPHPCIIIIIDDRRRKQKLNKKTKRQTSFGMVYASKNYTKSKMPTKNGPNIVRWVLRISWLFKHLLAPLRAPRVKTMSDHVQYVPTSLSSWWSIWLVQFSKSGAYPTLSKDYKIPCSQSNHVPTAIFFFFPPWWESYIYFYKFRSINIKVYTITPHKMKDMVIGVWT